MNFSISNIFGKKADSVLGLDIGSSSIKAVQLKKSGDKAILETYGELSLGTYANISVGQATKLPVSKIAEALRDLLGEKEVGITTRKCGLAIPFHASLLTAITMPAVKEKDLASMVPIEARKYIPVPITDVSLDWSVIPRLKVEHSPVEVPGGEKNKNPLETIDVLLAAIHNNIISEYKEVMDSSGLDASFFEIELFSSMRSVLEEGDKSVMIIDMGAASTKLFIVDRGVLRSSHTVNKGSQDMTANIARANGLSFTHAEVLKRNVGISSEQNENTKDAIVNALEYIFSEANRVLFAYENSMHVNVEKIILIGGGASLKGLRELSSEYLKTEVLLADPFSKVKAPAFLEDVLKESGPDFAVSLGVALRKLSEV